MHRQRILFIGGSLNQTTMCHSVARHLESDFECRFTPYYCDTYWLGKMVEKGWLDFTVMGGQARRKTEQYLRDHHLPMDYSGQSHDYDLVVTTQDILIQNNIRNKRIVLIQEGMTDPETLMYYLVKWLKLPRYLASTSTTGLSNAYDVFCVASEGYRDLFIRKGADPERIAVTGIPNFDNAAQYLDNDFPHRGYVMVNGVITMSGTGKELLSKEEVKAAYLEGGRH